MKNQILLVAAFAAILGGHTANAQVLFTGSYSENFDELGTTGTAAPTGWSVLTEAGSHNNFAPANSSTPGTSGALPNFTAGALSTKPTLTVNNSPSATGQTASAGVNDNVSGVTGVSGDRGLGSSPTGTAGTILELSLTNNTSSSLSAVTISYDIDRLSTTVNNNNTAAGFPNTGVEELPGYELYYNLTPGNNSTWVNVASLNPTIDMGTTGLVQVPNSLGVTTISPVTLTLSGTWAAGSTIQFAWFDDNAEGPSPDQSIALNNVAVTAAAAPEPFFPGSLHHRGCIDGLCLDSSP